MSATNNAVPAAPATCCSVATMALPCEYRCGLSAPSPVENSGVNSSARPRHSVVYAASTHQNDEFSLSSVMPQNTPLMMIVPGTTSTFGSEAVDEAADDRTEQAHEQATGQQQQADHDRFELQHVLHVDRQQDDRAEQREHARAQQRAPRP